MFPTRGLRRFLAGAVAAAFLASAAAAQSATHFIPYHYSWAQGNAQYFAHDLGDLPPGVENVLVSFALAERGEIVLQANDPAALRAEIAAAQADGVSVGVSTGGATAGYLTDMSGTPDEIAAKFVAFIEDWGFEFIDVDFEGSYVENPAQVDRMVAIMRAVRERLPGHPITLTVPSYGGDQGLSESVVGMAERLYDAGALDAVTAMSFDYYGLNRDVRQAARVSVGKLAKRLTGECTRTVASECARDFDQFPEARGLYGIITMIGEADDGDVTTVAEQRELTRFAKNNGLYSIGFWALNRDQGAGCSGGLAVCTNTDSAAGAYTAATAEALGLIDDGDDGGGDPGTPGDCPATWDADTVYTEGDEVLWQGSRYRARWWTQGDEPGTTGEWGVWESVAADGCADAGNGAGDGSGSDGGGGGCTATWDPSTAYSGGDVVRWQGVAYRAQWWSRGTEPGTDADNGAWQVTDPHTCGS
ncbi:carbohydrate-binding protein [Arhodomonas sp. AD133]|uniref:carbohydrate-binding protein n=1 Tax=Arhodomonas sp. AD133 TaxID=3415009 RepID=UPI003EB90D49